MPQLHVYVYSYRAEINKMPRWGCKVPHYLKTSYNSLQRPIEQVPCDYKATQVKGRTSFRACTVSTSQTEAKEAVF